MPKSNKEKLVEILGKPKADHLHDDTVKLFTEFIKRAIKDIDAGKSLDIQEQQRLVTADTFETLGKLSYNMPLIKYLQIPDEVIEDIPNKLDELLDACARYKQADGSIIAYKQPNLLNKPLKGLFTYLTEQNYSVDEQIKYLMQVYADCKYMDYHKIDKELLDAQISYYDDDKSKMWMQENEDNDEYVDYRNKYEAIRQVRTKLLS